jgi:hypothetical protein
VEINYYPTDTLGPRFRGGLGYGVVQTSAKGFPPGFVKGLIRSDIDYFLDPESQWYDFRRDFGRAVAPEQAKAWEDRLAASKFPREFWDEKWIESLPQDEAEAARAWKRQYFDIWNDYCVWVRSLVETPAYAALPGDHPFFQEIGGWIDYDIIEKINARWRARGDPLCFGRMYIDYSYRTATYLAVRLTCVCANREAAPPLLEDYATWDRILRARAARYGFHDPTPGYHLLFENYTGY